MNANTKSGVGKKTWRIEGLSRAIYASRVAASVPCFGTSHRTSFWYLLRACL